MYLISPFSSDSLIWLFLVDIMLSVSPLITLILFTYPFLRIDVHLDSGVKTQLDFLQQGLPGEEPFQ